MQNPFNLNLAEENESSSLVSEISNMFILVALMKDNASNLFPIELIFKWPAIIFSGFWIFLSLSPIFASTTSLCLILSNEFGIMFLCVMKCLHHSVKIPSFHDLPYLYSLNKRFSQKNNSYSRKLKHCWRIYPFQNC